MVASARRTVRLHAHPVGLWPESPGHAMLLTGYVASTSDALVAVALDLEAVFPFREDVPRPLRAVSVT